MTEIEKKAETFMGHKLNDNGEVVGAIPEFQHIMTDFTDRIIKEQERYVYKECWKLNIDPKVLEKQLIEIKRCQFMITQKDVEITELKAQIEKMKEDVRTEISRHSNLTENTLAFLLKKWEL